MNMIEITRMIKGLRKAGWSEKEINDFLIYIGSGEEPYQPPQVNRHPDTNNDH